MGSTYSLLALGWAVTVAAGFVVVLALFARRRGRADGVALVSTMLIALAVTLPCAVGLVVVARLDHFGIANVLWWSVVLAVPLAAVGVLFLRPTRPVLVVAVSALVLLPAMGVWGVLVEPRRLETKEAVVALDPGRAGAAPITVAVVSDLQFVEVGSHERAAIDRVMASSPDVVLVAGDLHQGDQATFEQQLPAIRALLGGLHAPGGVFLVGGDVDWPPNLPLMIEGTEVRLLANEIVEVVVRDRTLRIGGVELQYASPGAAATVAALEADPRTDDVRILLAHRPDVVSLLPVNARTDLVVAGHTHGGQISVPGFGPLATASSVPRAVAAGGLHDMDGRRIFVTTGVGMERNQAPPVRLFVNPTVAVLELRSGP